VIRLKLSVLLLSILGNTAVADSPEVYEAIGNIPIGTVFLTPAERALLDVKRLQPATSGIATGDSAGNDGEAQPTAKKAPPAAGYIISSSGRQQHWSGNDFVKSGDTSLPAMSFPGEVRITRHTEPAADAEPDDRDDD